MARSIQKTIGVFAAADLCGIRPDTLRARANRRKIPVWRFRPTLRFRLVDVLGNRELMRRLDPRGRPRGVTKAKNSDLGRLMSEVLS